MIFFIGFLLSKRAMKLTTLKQKISKIDITLSVETISQLVLDWVAQCSEISGYWLVDVDIDVSIIIFNNYDELYQYVFEDIVYGCVDENNASGIDEYIQLSNNILNYHCGRQVGIYPSADLLQRMYQQAFQQLHDELISLSINNKA
jgi:hypothetical protein